SRQLAETYGSAQRLDQVHGEVAPVIDGKAAIPADLPATLTLEQVSFGYPGAPRAALEDVTVSLPPGATVALVGPSGAGKTTVAALLLRFFDPATGAISFGGINLRDWPLEALRHRMALVAQDTYLFNATLRDNILLARPGASEADLAQAIERSALTGFIASLPEGLDTPVGERGVQLSGGQRQRVAIARAFLKDAPVLILDEATSHLDAISEAQVRSALAGLMKHRTTLVIAHRLSTVRDADLIVAMDKGRVVETGNHEALLARGGLYARLVGKQMGRQAAAE
ncbi:MAG: ABC transporter ATP-binding protein, partial [Elsteraceae bacterium]